jgi:hypothetical protein
MTSCDDVTVRVLIWIRVLYEKFVSTVNTLKFRNFRSVVRTWRDAKNVSVDVKSDSNASPI